MNFKEVKEYAKTITKLAPYVHKEKFEEMFEEMAVHTRKRKPEDLLLKRRPNEPEDVLKYRVDNYEPITYGSMNKAFDNLNRILNAVNYKLYPNNDEVSAYLTTKKFMDNTFDIFFSKIYLKRMIEDPNGFLIWLPGGKGVENSSEIVKPYPELMFSFNIIDWGKDYIVFLSNENSFIKRGEVIEKIGKIYYILTTDSFYKYTELNDNKYELKLIYTHNLGELPIIPLGGDLNADGFYESFFAPYVGFGNEAIRQFSDWQSLSVMSAHPIREEFFTQCEMAHVDRKKGKKGEDDENKTYSRMVELKPMSRSPFSTIQRPIGETNSNGIGEQYLPYDIPSVRFISPGVEYVKNAQESYLKLIEMAEDSLHLNLGEISLSGKAKEIDLLSHDDMLTKIANQLLDAKQQSMRYILAYMTNSSFDDSPVKLTKPSSFRVRTEAELTKELTDLKSNNAPAMLISAVARDLSMMRFSGDEINQKIFEVIATYDPLFTYSIAEKQSMVLSGTATKIDAIKSAFYYSVLLNMSKDDGEAVFLARTIDDIQSKFNEDIKQYLTADFTIVDNNGQA